MTPTLPGSIPATEGPVFGPAPRPTCTACPHPADAHDPIGVRFCAVTSSRGLTRGCVCVGAAVV
ncbi:MAG: hypothetical protein QOG20_3116 [Pseudonocardiales bacterium]|jgi:hypothetical protein|nr:hypothetical protein [Pseudonocardiales bacterium]